MKQTVFLLLFFNIGLLSYGQSDGYIPFDYSSFSFKDSIAENSSFKQVVQEINRYCDTEVEKLCLVAGWMYENIDFDVNKFTKGGSIPDYRVVFSSRKGICGDYTALFYQFCKQLQIKCEIIEGYVPEFKRDNRIYRETNHAWNVVKIGDYWYHCDLLGFSGLLRQSSGLSFQFIKQVNASEFLTRDLSFIALHIPADPMWQLSEYPVGMDTLLKYGIHHRVDSTAAVFDYKKKINNYLKMGAVQKQLTFADNAYVYNRHNCNAIVVNYYNASVDLINQWKGDKSKLLKARKYLNRAGQFVGKASNGVEKLAGEIEKSQAIINKYLK